jgi:MOSC domain-containing protein YiiM
MATRSTLVSINVGSPREILSTGRRIRTCIFKEPVSGPVAVHRMHLEGDQQADLRVHGGRDKAVYVYPSEHYQFWRPEFPDMALPFGWFGENLTIEGLLETEVNTGDRLRIGTAEFQVTTPRVPCYKLEAKFGRNDLIKRFLAARRSGFYFAVLQEGVINSGDSIELIAPDTDRLTISELFRLYADRHADPADLLRAANAPALPEGWREQFQERVRAAKSEPGA